MRLARQFRSFLSNASFRADAGLGIVGSPSPDSDYWYHGLGHRSAAGPSVSPGSATRLSAVFACTRVCAETAGSLPFSIYRQRKGGGRDLASDHPAYELLLNPNPWQTAMEYFEMMQAHLELRGNAYALKVPGKGRAIDQLIPLHPDRVRVFLLPNNRLRYEVTSYSTGRIDRYSQDEIVHERGLSYDGIMGISTVSAMAEVIGVGLAQQEHRARYFRNSAIPGMAIETVKMTDEARETMVNSISEKFSAEGAFKVFAPPPGAKITSLGLTNKDSQLIEASNASKIEICGAWRVPPHKIADLSKGTFGNIEQQNIEFATDCIRPRIIRRERRYDRDLIDSLRAYESSTGEYFLVFNMDALFRGDMKSRYEAYAAALPWMRRDEMREAEGRNPIGGDAAELLVPVNMETISQAERRADRADATADAATEAAAAASQSPAKSGSKKSTAPFDDAAPDQEDEEESNARLRGARLRALAIASADRIVRREAKALRKMAQKAKDGPTIESDIWDFYRDLAPVVAESLVISAEQALHYCNAHAVIVANARASVLDMAIDRIEEEGPAQLADLALAGARSLSRRTKELIV